MTLIKRVCFGLWIVSVLFFPVWASDWPHYLGPNYDFQPEVKKWTAQSVIQRWTAQVNTGMCSVTVADGRLYTMGNNGPQGGDEAHDIVYWIPIEGIAATSQVV